MALTINTPHANEEVGDIVLVKGDFEGYSSPFLYDTLREVLVQLGEIGPPTAATLSDGGTNGNGFTINWEWTGTFPRDAIVGTPLKISVVANGDTTEHRDQNDPGTTTDFTQTAEVVAVLAPSPRACQFSLMQGQR